MAKSKKMILFVVYLLAMVLVCDVLLANMYKMAKGYPWPLRTLHENQVFIANQKKIRRPSAHYHHDLRPMMGPVTVKWGNVTYDVVTNSLGFRDSVQREVLLAGDKPRILFAGGSFTEGTGATYQKSFVGRVGTRLAVHGVEVLNAGVGAYGPSHVSRKVRFLVDSVGLKFDHLVVLVNARDAMDEMRARFGDEEKAVAEAVPSEQRRPSGGLKKLIWGNTFALYTVLNMVHDSWKKRDDAAQWPYNERVYEKYKLGIRSMKTNLGALSALVDSVGIGMTLLVYPLPVQILDDKADSRLVREFSQWAEEHNVNFIDLFPALFDPALGSPKNIVAEYYIPNDSHWNEDGCELAAQAFVHSAESTILPALIENRAQ